METSRVVSFAAGREAKTDSTENSVFATDTFIMFSRFYFLRDSQKFYTDTKKAAL